MMRNYWIYGFVAGLAALGGLQGCGLVADDDDSAADDDDSTGDDDDSTGDDDDSAGDDDDSAGDDDDPPPPLSLTSIDIDCTDDLSRSDHSLWRVQVNAQGWFEQDTLVFFMWDQNIYNPGNGNPSYHYMDAWQPFTDFINIDYTEGGIDVEGYTDRWGIGFESNLTDGGSSDAIVGWATPAEAEDAMDADVAADPNDPGAKSHTIFKCFDSNGNDNVDLFNYMVCGTDFWDLTVSHCWYCGDEGEIGNNAGPSSSNLLGEVGHFDDGSVTYDVTALENDVGATWSCTYLGSH